jgi:hypothetical protein
MLFVVDTYDTLLIHYIYYKLEFNYMPTTKKRLNISLSPLLEEAVERLAARDKTPQATKITELLKEAIELEEDQVWDAIASQREARDAKFTSHKNAWK